MKATLPYTSIILIQLPVIALMVTFVWLMVALQHKEDLKCVLMEYGVVSVQLGLIQLMLMLCVMN